MLSSTDEKLKLDDLSKATEIVALAIFDLFASGVPAPGIGET